jgi:hypothetical protein
MGRKHDRLSKEFKGAYSATARARADVGLRQLNPVRRKCLKCEKKFDALENCMNFLCDYCRHQKNEGLDE